MFFFFLAFFFFFFFNHWRIFFEKRSQLQLGCVRLLPRLNIHLRTPVCTVPRNLPPLPHYSLSRALSLRFSPPHGFPPFSSSLLIDQVGNEKKSVSFFFFWCLGNLEAISFLFFLYLLLSLSVRPTSCLKATLSQEYSHRLPLSDERETKRKVEGGERARQRERERERERGRERERESRCNHSTISQVH